MALYAAGDPVLKASLEVGIVPAVEPSFNQGRRRRREYRQQFKAEVLARCVQPGASVGGVAERIRKSLNERGTLDVLRRGVADPQAPLMRVQFKPALAINPAIQAHNAADWLRVVQ